MYRKILLFLNVSFMSLIASLSVKLGKPSLDVVSLDETNYTWAENIKINISFFKNILKTLTIDKIIPLDNINDVVYLKEFNISEKVLYYNLLIAFLIFILCIGVMLLIKSFLKNFFIISFLIVFVYFILLEFIKYQSLGKDVEFFSLSLNLLSVTIGTIVTYLAILLTQLIKKAVRKYKPINR